MAEFDIRKAAGTTPETERDYENALRPLSFDSFSGQREVVENLKVFVMAARMRQEALDHVLLHGPPGLGKTTLSNIIANELSVGFKVTSGPVLDKPGDLAGLLTSLEKNDVLFIDEIHRLSPIVEEYLYSAMEDYRIDILIDKGPSARSIQIDLAPFTLVGATTRSGLLTGPLRARFGINMHLEYYDTETLTRIIHRSADILGVGCDTDAAKEIAGRSRGTPRIANELSVGFKVTSGPVLDKPGDLAGLLTSLEKNDVLFIDEIHRLSPIVEEYLYSAMEDYRIDILIDKGPSARSIQIDLAPFTLVGATTRSGLLTGPLRARFGINMHLEYYDTATLTRIIHRSADILGVGCDTDAAKEIAGRSRGTPRIANALLRRVRDFAQVKGSGRVDREIACYALEALHIDRYGLDLIDNKILNLLIDKFNGGPVGLTTIATALGEDPGTLEEVYEPFLIQEGFLKRTPRGREVTQLAYEHLGKVPTPSQGSLF